MSSIMKKAAGAIKQFRGQRANPKNNFFQNYSEHLNALDNKLFKEYNKIKTPDDFASTILSHATVFEPLRDTHDYADDIFGATVLPILAAALSLAAIANTFYEGAQVLLMKAGLMTGDADEHSQLAINSFMVSATSLAVAVASLIKSVVSLFARPIATMVCGYKDQDEVRFKDDLSEDESLFAKLAPVLA